MPKPINHSRGGGDLLAKLKTTSATCKRFLYKQPLFIPLIILAIGISLTGYGLIKNLKSNNQSASAEQLPGTPESGAKSRITELYDALVAQNKGSDTDVSGLTAAPGDWGAKWNRIKTAALRGGGGDVSIDLGEQSIVKYIDPKTGLRWSHPVMRVGHNIVAKSGTGYTEWAKKPAYMYGQNNVIIGNKTDEEICQMLGSGWRMPDVQEAVQLREDANYGDITQKASLPMLTRGEHRFDGQIKTHLYDWKRNTSNTSHVSRQTRGMIACVK